MNLRSETHETRIDGFSVELELYVEDGEQRSTCTVSKGNYASSLTKLMHTGTLDHEHTSEELEVRDMTIARIEAWADAHGY